MTKKEFDLKLSQVDNLFKNNRRGKEATQKFKDIIENVKETREKLNFCFPFYEKILSPLDELLNIELSKYLRSNFNRTEELEENIKTLKKECQKSNAYWLDDFVNNTIGSIQKEVIDVWYEFSQEKIDELNNYVEGMIELMLVAQGGNKW